MKKYKIKITFASLLVFLAMVGLANAASYTLKQNCQGPLNFDIEPLSTSPKGDVTIIGSGLSDCAGHTIEFSETNRKTGGGSPMPDIPLGSCTSTATGCSISIKAPKAQRNYDYIAKLMITSGTGNSQLSEGDILASNLQTLQVRECFADPPSKNFALQNGCQVAVSPYALDTEDGSGGRWTDSSIGSSSTTTTFDDKTSGNCNGDASFRVAWNTAPNWISISSDSPEKKCGLFGCPHDFAYGFKLSTSDTQDTKCSILQKPSSCLDASKQFICPVAGKNIKTTIGLVYHTVSSQTVDFVIGECTANDRDDGTSTTCHELHGTSKPKCDIQKNICEPQETPCASSNPNDMCTISCSTGSIHTVNGQETPIIGNTLGYWKLATTGKNKVTIRDNPTKELDSQLRVGTSVGASDLCYRDNGWDGDAERCSNTELDKLEEGTYYIKIDNYDTTSGIDYPRVTCERILEPPILRSPNNFAILSDSTPTLEWERNPLNPSTANDYNWFIESVSDSFYRGGHIFSSSPFVSVTTPALKPGYYIWSAAQSKLEFQPEIGFEDYVPQEYAQERFLTVCGTCQSSKNMGALNNYGQTISGSTCALTSTAQDDIFEFNVNKKGYLKVQMYHNVGPFETVPSCDWDFYVNAGNFCGSESVYIARSATNVQCDDSATGYSLAGNSYVKVHRNSGGGSATINVQLLECVADSTLDAACPAEKSLCHNNKCVECYSNDLNTEDNLVIGDNINDRSNQCPASRPRCELDPASPDLYTCVPPDPCNTNENCPTSQCCTADPVLGSLPFRESEGQCRDTGTLRTTTDSKFLCT